MSKLFERLLEVRGLDRSFLCPKYESLTNPFTLPGLDKAIDRIKRAVDGHEKILIYGDYDVDGVTASTVMADALTLAGANPQNIDIMLPDRFADGYGMSPRLITRAKKQGTKLVITVDCGSRNHAIIDELNTLNIDTIVTDHHEPRYKDENGEFFLSFFQFKFLASAVSGFVKGACQFVSGNGNIFSGSDAKADPAELEARFGAMNSDGYQSTAASFLVSGNDLLYNVQMDELLAAMEAEEDPFNTNCIERYYQRYLEMTHTIR